MKLSEIFKPLYIEEVLEGNVYAISLLAKHNDLVLFGKELDGENYRDDCWKCILTKGDSNWYESITYVTNEGEEVEYLTKIDNEFRGYVFKVLNI